MRKWRKVSAESSVGCTYGLLTVDSIEYKKRPVDGRSRAWANCTCVCGGKHAAWLNGLRRGTPYGCPGCYKLRLVARLTKHGHCLSGGVSPEYAIWSAMWDRCDNPNNAAWEDYGGRSITVDKKWAEFSVFIADMGLRPSKNHSLERINNSNGYGPDNCRWATRKEQNRNTRHNHIIEALGQRLVLQEWAEKLGVDRTTIYRNAKKHGGFVAAIEMIATKLR